jgi:photosystem II stability/assembly factor-like uncharacterized protein
MRASRSILFWTVLSVLALVAGVFNPLEARTEAEAGACPPGYSLLSKAEARERAAGAGLGAEREGALEGLCINDKHPELFSELNALWGQETSARLAPYGSAEAGAHSAALAQAKTLPKKSGKWQPVGDGLLYSAEPGYDSVNGLGLVELAGRITDLEYVAKKDQLFAAVGYGGVWRSDDHGKSWKSIANNLPTQIVGSVAHTSARGGALLALTGDNSFGRDSLEGIGAFWSTNGGKTWHRAKGIPDGAFGFKLAVDQANQNLVYAATGAGLFRSTDAGRSYKNVRLPTGACAGKSNTKAPCKLANIVTDVVVQMPGGRTNEKGHAVTAAVGWRAGNKANPDGTVQSPANGIYSSPTGAPGTFKKLAAPGFAPQDRIGRIELGAAVGENQDHNYLYAIVGDAFYLNENTETLTGIDVPDSVETVVPGVTDIPTNLNGVYVSPDFGQTWRLMADALEFLEPQTGSALAAIGPVAALGPGVQAWYNLFIEPDPTRQDPVLGVPTRVSFGLEEVWQNEVPILPQMAKSQFKVIGRYFSGETCLFLLNTPVCPTDRQDALVQNTTTHPDQHAAVYIPEKDGGVTMVVGNDGGVYTQRVGPGEDFSNAGWGKGSNRGFNTLLPYNAAIANDGTVWMGLQDNGTVKIDPKTGKHIMALGGDGFYVGVDPFNSKVAYAETTYAAMEATTDGGKTWTDMAPDIDDTSFNNPFVMDPKNAMHLMTAGRQIVETTSGPGTGTDGWKQVFDLGTVKKPGTAAPSSDTNPANQMSAIDLVGANAYVGFCGPCDVLDQPLPFNNGLVTNVRGSKPAKIGTSQGWHFARAKGLPNRVITSVAMDPKKPSTVYVSLGGYARPWTQPGTLDDPRGAGRGHVFKSTNAGKSFTNISSNLPNAPVWWVEYNSGRLVIASDVGVFIRSGKSWKRLGTGLPPAYVRALAFKPNDSNLLIAANYGRGVWAYRFGPPKAPEIKGKQEKKIKAAPATGAKVGGTFTFDASAEGWTTATNNPVTAWRRQPPGDASPFAFAAVPYADQSSASLTSPKFSLPKLKKGSKYEGYTVSVEFSLLQNLEPNFDYLTVEWSSDGKKWKVAESYTGLNEGFPLFSKEKVTLAAPAGKSLYVRFRVASDQLISFPAYQGSIVDNVTITR